MWVYGQESVFIFIFLSDDEHVLVDEKSDM